MEPPPPNIPTGSEPLPLTLPAGTEISGLRHKYTIEAPLRPGASGVVYKARVSAPSPQAERDLGRPPSYVAIKFFLPVFLHVYDLFRAEGRDRLARLQRWHEQELKCLSNLEHSNIVSILDDGVFTPEPDQLRHDLRPYEHVSFLVTRFVEGVDLAELLNENIDVVRLVEILKNVCDALIYLHEQRNYLHADIRPENIVVEFATNRAVIVDFALFKNFNFSEVAADGITRLTADRRTLPEGVPIKDESDVHGSRSTLKALWFPKLDLCQFGTLLLRVADSQARFLALEERDYLLVVSRRLRDWAALEGKSARWARDQIVKLDPAYTRYMGVEELKPPSSASRYLQIPNRQVTVSNLVNKLLETRSFRRLRSINQLALVDLIYPGAGYRRYQHCLRAYGYCADFLLSLSNSPDFRLLFTPALARQTLVLALLHDINHFAFLHTFQELNWKSFREITLLDVVCDGAATGDTPSIYKIVEDETGLTRNELRDILFEDHTRLVELGYPPGLQIAKSLIDSGADVDKLAYLEDDSAETGVAYGRGVDAARLIASATVAEVDVELTKGWHLAYREEGTAAVESLVMARYWMFRTVYWHRVNRAVMAMLLEVARGVFPEEVSPDPQLGLFAEPDTRPIPPNPIREFIVQSMWKPEEYVLELLNARYREIHGSDSIIADLLKQPTRIFKRLYSLQGTDLNSAERTVHAALDGFNSQQVLSYRKALVAQLNKEFKPERPLRLEDVLLDIPGRRLDSSGDIYIVRDSGEARRLAELEGPVKHVVREFNALAKRVRIFVTPDFEPGEAVSTPSFRTRILGLMKASLPQSRVTEMK